MWFIESRRTGNRLTKEFSSRGLAEQHIKGMGSVFVEEYKTVHSSGNTWLDHVLNEGLEKGDLNRILLPRLSIDEYVPSDPQTDNIVVAFFVKGVPEAVIPFKNFCEKSNGVLDVDYGDSDTIINTSVVYVEFDRENIEIQDLDELVEQVAMIAALEKDDFTMTFPHTNTKFPYNPKLLQKYFVSRSRRKNQLAQRKAEKRAQADAQKNLQQYQSLRQRSDDEQPMESIVDKLADMLLESK